MECPCLSPPALVEVVRPSERLTAARCLEMLSSDEIEGDLTTIFA